MPHRLLLPVLIACLNGPAALLAQCNQWQPIPTPTTNLLRAVHFPDAQNGWAVGSGGTLLRSSDGGATWTAQSAALGAGTADLYGVHFANATTGWVVGAGGFVKKTTNGGGTWSAQTVNTSTDLYDVFFSDANTGWIAGACGLILRTTNGGSTWAAVSSGQNYHLYGIASAGGSNVAAASSGAVLLRSSDSGATWPSGNNSSTGTDRSFRALAFSGATGWAANSAGKVWKTANSGGAWSALAASPAGSWQSAAAVSSTTVYVAGLAGALSRSTDGGSTWADFSDGIAAEDLHGLQMLDANTGWAVGAGGKVFRYVGATAAPACVASIPLHQQTNVATNTVITWAAVSGCVGGYRLSLGTTPGGTDLLNNQDLGNVTTYQPAAALPAGKTVYVRLTPYNAAGSAGGCAEFSFGTAGSGTSGNGPGLPAGDCWTWQNPLPQGNGLNDVFFVDGQTGWAVGLYGAIIKTTDGGSTWARQISGTSNHLTSVHFMDAQKGWVVGAEGSILKTVNGGSTWVIQILVTNDPLSDIHFADAETGWTVSSSGTILKTVNGGNTWGTRALGASTQLSSVHFTDAQTGWAVGNGIFKTTDGGNTWVRQTWTSGLFDVHFRDGQTGWAVGNGGILKTIDGGNNWVPQAFAHRLSDVHFTDAKTGWAVGYYGTILRTIDGGNIWTKQTSGTNEWLNSVHFTDAKTGWAVGDNGTILKTIDGGNNWIEQTSGTNEWLNSVHFTDAKTGWAVGDNGTILKTIDGGNKWAEQTSGTNSSLSDVHFTDGQTGWAVGNSGTILKTIDGGNNWVEQTSVTNYSLYDVHFADAQTGWIVGYYGTILRTIDGGNIWTKQTSGTNDELYSVHFTDAQTGWVVGWNGTILKTIDGGNNWAEQTFGTNYSLYDVRFVDAQTGWTVGEYGTILRTIDGGNTWTKQTSGTNDELYSVHFTDAQTGWAVGYNGIILKTIDGGNTWGKQTSTTNVQLNSVYFSDAQTGWTVGFSTILKYTPSLPACVISIPLHQKNNVITGTTITWPSVNSCVDGYRLSLGTTPGGTDLLSNQDVGKVTTYHPTKVLPSGKTIYVRVIPYNSVGSASGCAEFWFTTTEDTASNSSGLITGGCWTWQNPLPHGRQLVDAFWGDDQTIWMLGGNGTILKTLNGGTSWAEQETGAAWLSSIFFINKYEGWVAGDGGVILKTIDGGGKWVPQHSGTQKDLTSVRFIGTQIGWAVGYNGIILKTVNGGDDWFTQYCDTTVHFQSIQFVDNQTGWVLGYNWKQGYNSKVILKTVDGGNNWVSQNFGTNNLESIYFTDGQTGWAVGLFGTILKTVDGGNNWITQNSGITNHLGSVYFTDGQIGWAAGDGIIVKTVDGGENWEVQHYYIGNFFVTPYFNSYFNPCFIRFFGNKTGWAISYNGDILKTVDGGANWLPQSFGAKKSLSSTYFIDSQTGWAVGDGIIQKTVNGGTNWVPQNSPNIGNKNYLLSVYFINSQVGWAVGSKGVILKTFDGGTNWINQYPEIKNSFTAVYFVDNNIGWIIGWNGAIEKTIDGGKNWFKQNSNTTNKLSAVCFIDTQTGWIVGDGGTILKTVDAGINWVVQNSNTNKSLNSVCFLDAQIGWIVGDSTILKTIDAGVTWSKHNLRTIKHFNFLYFSFWSIFFVNQKTGWMLGSNYPNDLTTVFFGPVNNLILKTTDGGITWNIENITSWLLQSMYFTDEKTGWVVGGDGAILKYTPSLPSCIPTIPLHQQTNIATDTTIIWSPAGGCEDAYRLSLGTTPGGSDLLSNQIIYDTFYKPVQPLPKGKRIYVHITPFNVVGNAAGCTEFNFMTVPDCTIAPMANISGPTALCNSQSITLEAGAGATAYKWSNGATTQGITAGVAATYTVTITDVRGCTGTASQTVGSAIPNPTTQITGPTALCNGQAVTLDAGAGFSIYTWSNGATTQGNSVNVAGIYTVTVANGAGCTAAASRTLTAQNAPDLSAKGDTLTCAKAMATLRGNSSVAGAIYFWTGPGGFTSQQQNPVTAVAGLYTVVATAPNGCTNSASATVAQDAAQPDASAFGGSLTCSTLSVLLRGFSTATGAKFTWTGPSGFVSQQQNAPTTVPGPYTLVVTAPNGCSASSATQVVENKVLTPPAPIAPVSVCPGRLGTLDAGPGYADYNWSNGQNGQTMQTNQGGYYTVTVTGYNGCTARGGGNVTLFPAPQPQVLGPNALCPGGTALLRVEPAFVSYAWSVPGQTGQTLPVAATGTYWVTVTDANQCTAVGEQTLTAASPPNLTLLGDRAFCPGLSATLDAGPDYDTYAWSVPGQTGRTLTVAQAGLYAVTVSKSGGCTGTASASVAAYPAAVAYLSANEGSGLQLNDGRICEGSPVYFTGNGGDLFRFFLNGNPLGPLSPNPSAQLSNLRQGDVVRLLVQTAQGCIDSTRTGEPVGQAPIAVQVDPLPNWSGSSLTLQAGCPGDSVWVAMECPQLQDGTYEFTYAVYGANNNVGVWVPASLRNKRARLPLGPLGATGASTFQLLSLRNAQGCERALGSNVTLPFQLAGSVSSTLPVNRCKGQPYPFNGALLTQGGIYFDTLQSAGGCDSIVRLELTFSSQLFETTAATICQGDTFYFQGRALTKGDIYRDTLATVGGCDSIITLALSVNAAPLLNLERRICQGESFQLGGRTFDTEGDFVVMLPSPSGCDTLALLKLRLSKPNAKVGPDVAICAGSGATLAVQGPPCLACQYAWSVPGAVGPSVVVKPAETTAYSVTVRDAQGCVAADTIQVRVAQAVRTERVNVLCKGQTDTVGTQTFNRAGIYQVSLKSAAGCDSLVQLDLRFVDPADFEAERDSVLLLPDERARTVPVLENDLFPADRRLVLDTPRTPHGEVSWTDEDALEYRVTDDDFVGVDTVRYRICPPTGCEDACAEGLLLVSVQSGTLEPALPSIPNVITPNGDNRNDIFDPLSVLKTLGLNIPEGEASLSIISRWGDLVFRADPYQPWDGFSGKQLVPQGTYYWLLRFGDVAPVRGAIQVLRE